MPSTSEYVLGLDASEDIAPSCWIFDKDVGVASPDIDIGFGENHAHIVDNRCEERPVGIHLSEAFRCGVFLSSHCAERRASPVPGRDHQTALRPSEHPGDSSQVLNCGRFLAGGRPAAHVESRDLIGRSNRPKKIDKTDIAVHE